MAGDEARAGVVVVQETEDAAGPRVGGQGAVELPGDPGTLGEHVLPGPPAQVLRPVVGEVVAALVPVVVAGRGLGDQEQPGLSVAQHAAPGRPVVRPSPLHAPARVDPVAVDVELGHPVGEDAVDVRPHVGVVVVQVGQVRPVEVVRRPPRGIAVIPVVVLAVGEERVQVRGVVGDEVEQDAEAPGVGAADEGAQVVLIAVVRAHRELVAHGVAEVAGRAGRDRRQPDRVDSQPGQVRQPVGDRPQRRRAEAGWDHAVDDGGRVLLGHRLGYFRPLSAMPRTMYRWNTRKAISTGSVASTEPAITRSQDVRCAALATNSASPSGTV